MNDTPQDTPTPVEPVTSTPPVAPVQPTQPVQPTEPASPTQPVQPTQAPQVHQSKTPVMAIIAVILGSIGIICVIVPGLGIVLGIAALVLALMARKRYAPSKLWLSGLITGIIAALLGIGVLMLLLIGLIFGSVLDSVGNTSRTSDYKQEVASLEADEKSFTANEVATIGPYDVTVVSVTSDAVPNADDQSRITLLSRGSFAEDYGLSLSDEQITYTELTLNLKKNDNTEAASVSTTVNSWAEEFKSLELDGVYSIRKLPEELDSNELRDTDVTDTAEGFTFTMLYRLPKGETPTKLTYTIGVFTSVSSIVGTEGMPRKDFVYTIALR